MFSVLIPVYNEREILKKNLEKLVKHLDGLGGKYEIVVCSNGSTDGTDAIGGILAKKHPGKINFISIETRGVGYAFREMVLAAKSDKLVCFDADLTTDLKFLGECAKMLDEYDIVLGSKMIGEQKRGIHRIMVSKGYINLVRLLFRLDFGDYSIGAKGYRKSRIINHLEDVDAGSSYVLEMVYHVIKEGGSVTEIPVFCNDTRGSKFNIFHEIIYRFKNLLAFWIKTKRVK
ncbi:MAG TPA: glycosyltransferase [Candidatus Altiarchaeales archaeon]|nr:glycosyltransferase [Candidatus Altiarchaeales archaeon]